MANNIKDKAIEVYKKHYDAIDNMGSAISRIQHRIAIKAAIVTVEGIICILSNKPPRPSNIYQTANFWQEVKEEIEKW